MHCPVHYGRTLACREAELLHLSRSIAAADIAIGESSRRTQTITYAPPRCIPAIHNTTGEGNNGAQTITACIFEDILQQITGQ